MTLYADICCACDSIFGNPMAMQSLLTMIKVSVFGKWTERTFFSDLKQNSLYHLPKRSFSKILIRKSFDWIYKMIPQLSWRPSAHVLAFLNPQFSPRFVLCNASRLYSGAFRRHALQSREWKVYDWSYPASHKLSYKKIWFVTAVL